MNDWTTLMASARAWLFSATPVPERRPVVVALERPTPRVPTEYMSLYTYLERRYASIVVLTFDQMESLMGMALPVRAFTERDWWTGVAVLPDRHSEAWVGAGRTAMPNLSARTVTFERLP